MRELIVNYWFLIESTVIKLMQGVEGRGSREFVRDCKLLVLFILSRIYQFEVEI